MQSEMKTTLDNVLPDSRTKRPTGAIPGPSLWYSWVPIYCANCGDEGGKVPESNMTFAFWLCNNCFESFGAIAATMVVPDEVFWNEINNNKKNEER